MLADVEAAGIDGPDRRRRALVGRSRRARRRRRARRAASRHVVLSAALVPAEGGCGIDCMKPRHREGLVLARSSRRDRDGTVITLPGRARRSRDRSATRTAATRSTTTRSRSSSIRCAACPTPCTTTSSRSTGRSPRDVPVTYVLNERDRPVPPADAGADGRRGCRSRPPWCGSTPATCRRSPPLPPWPTCWRPSPSDRRRPRRLPAPRPAFRGRMSAPGAPIRPQRSRRGGRGGFRGDRQRPLRLRSRDRRQPHPSPESTAEVGTPPWWARCSRWCASSSS